MLLDVHEGKISLPIDIDESGDNIIVAGANDSWIYIHEVIGSAEGAVEVQFISGSDILASINLDEAQGLTLDDIPGDEGVPRFKCPLGQDFIINLSDDVRFSGSVVYSRRY